MSSPPKNVPTRDLHQVTRLYPSGAAQNFLEAPRHVSDIESSLRVSRLSRNGRQRRQKRCSTRLPMVDLQPSRRPRQFVVRSNPHRRCQPNGNNPQQVFVTQQEPVILKRRATGPTPLPNSTLPTRCSQGGESALLLVCQN